MSIDPDELKVRRIKKMQLVEEVQAYMEAMHEAENAMGKLGHHVATKGKDITGKISAVLHDALKIKK